MVSRRGVQKESYLRVTIENEGMLNWYEILFFLALLWWLGVLDWMQLEQITDRIFLSLQVIFRPGKSEVKRRIQECPVCPVLHKMLQFNSAFPALLLGK